MIPQLRPHLLRVAREAAGFTQTRAAEVLKVTQVSLSRWEAGSREPSTADLDAMAGTYGVTREFFFASAREAGLIAGDVHHRRRKGAKVSDVRRLEAKTNVLRIGATRLLQHVDVEPVFDIPDLTVDEWVPSVAAREVRRFWQLPIGPIANLTELLELAGVIVVHDEFPASGLDGVSMWAGHVPILLVNEQAPADRKRFTMAHELGHLVLHRQGYDETSAEREADQFASELLMPAGQIRPRLTRLTLRKALDVKLEWYASVASLIVRAKDIGAISPEDATRLHKQRSYKGWTRHEPHSDLLPPETPSTLAAVRRTLSHAGLSDRELAELLYLPSLGCHPSFRQAPVMQLVQGGRSGANAR